MLDYRKSYAPLVDNIVSASFFAIFVANGLCYIAVVSKIRASQKKLKYAGNHGGASRQEFKTATVVMVLVAAYLFQFSSVLVHTVWIRIAPPHYMIYIIQAIFINLGGVYNMLAYTVVRKAILAKPKAPVKPQVSTITTGVESKSEESSENGVYSSEKVRGARE